MSDSVIVHLSIYPSIHLFICSSVHLLQYNNNNNNKTINIIINKFLLLMT
jgi:hypothetical protein